MRTAGLTMNDVWADRVLRERGVEVHRQENQPAEIGVLVDIVELSHRGKQENYRPYLHLIGELRSVTPAQRLPYGISQITYSPGQGEKVDAFYEFDDEQLVALARKGYFNAEFEVPEEVTGTEWELPATVDLLVVAPSAQSEAPIVFTRVQNVASLEIGLSNSGYDITDYFADYFREGAERTPVAVDERTLRARSTAITALFSEDELELEGLDQQPQTAPAVEEPAAGVDVVLREAQAAVEAERAQYQAELESTAGTTENLYASRVASPLRDSDAYEPQHAAAEPVTNIDFELEDPDIEARDREVARPTFDDRSREVSRRAADLDFGDDDDHDLGA